MSTNRSEPVDEWQFGLFACCQGGACKCLKMMACICCMYGRAISVGLERGYVCCCLCGLNAVCCTRKKLRTKYNIEGTKCEDCSSSCCCLACASWQMIQEVEYQQKIDIHWSGKATPKQVEKHSKRRKGRKSRKKKHVNTTTVAPMQR